MASVTSNVNFLSVKFREPNTGHKTDRMDKVQVMEISPDKKKEEKMMAPPQQIVERRVLRECQNIQPNVRNGDLVTNVKKDKVKDKSFYHVAKSKLTQQLLGENKTKSKSKKLTMFNVLNLKPSDILNDDLLSMNVDLLDPTTRMREMFIKLPDDVVNTYAHLNYHFNCPEYAQDVYCYLQSIERQFCFGDDYLSSDPEVTPQMRAILTDWLIQVQVHEELCQQTLHLAVAFVL